MRRMKTLFGIITLSGSSDEAVLASATVILTQFRRRLLRQIEAALHNYVDVVLGEKLTADRESLLREALEWYDYTPLDMAYYPALASELLSSDFTEVTPDIFHREIHTLMRFYLEADNRTLYSSGRLDPWRRAA